VDGEIIRVRPFGTGEGGSVPDLWRGASPHMYLLMLLGWVCCCCHQLCAPCALLLPSVCVTQLPSR